MKRYGSKRRDEPVLDEPIAVFASVKNGNVEGDEKDREKGIRRIGGCNDIVF